MQTNPVNRVIEAIKNSKNSQTLEEVANGAQLGSDRTAKILTDLERQGLAIECNSPRGAVYRYMPPKVIVKKDGYDRDREAELDRYEKQYSQV